MLVQMAISRTREYAADDMGARISGSPESLASALAKIDVAARRIENVPAERNPATAHLFIINPLSGERMDNLFSTHPSTESDTSHRGDKPCSDDTGSQLEGGLSIHARGPSQ